MPKKKDPLINGLHRQVPDMLKPKTAEPMRVKKQVEMLEVKIIVHKAENLAVSDFSFGFIPNQSDPYAKVRFLPQGPGIMGGDSVLYLGKTRVVYKDLNPVWNQCFSATVQRSQIQQDALFQLRLFDKDTNSKDDPLGVVFCPIFAHGNNEKEEHKDWYQVRAISGSEGQGRVQCTIKLTPRTQEIVQMKGLQQHYFALKFRVIKAEGLKKGGYTSDPYVVVRLKQPHDYENNLLLGKTEFIPHTLDPVWNEVFGTRLPIDELDPHAIFELTVEDRNNKKKDEVIGVVQVPVHDLFHKINPDEPSVKATHWYDVPPDSAPGAKGRVRCKLTLTLLMAESGPSP